MEHEWNRWWGRLPATAQADLLDLAWGEPPPAHVLVLLREIPDALDTFVETWQAHSPSGAVRLKQRDRDVLSSRFATCLDEHPARRP